MKFLTIRPIKVFAVATVFVGFSFKALAQSHPAELPNYVIERFGAPPTIPVGQLSDEVQAAVDSVFVNGFTHGGWKDEQTAALARQEEELARLRQQLATTTTRVAGVPCPSYLPALHHNSGLCRRGCSGEPSYST